MRLAILFTATMMLAGCAATPAQVSVMTEEQLRDIWSMSSTPHEAVRERWIELNPDWSEQHKADILEGTIRKGMTGDMVRAARGNPMHIDKSDYGWGKLEDWVYENQWPHNYFSIQFRDGVVSDWTRMSRSY